MAKYLASLALFFVAATAAAHDTWVQTNTHLVRPGDVLHVDLMLGNHGNDHRDFKLASKVSTNNITLEVISPTGKKYDLLPELIDLGYAPKEGFWTNKFKPAETGLHIVAHTGIGGHATTRSIKSGKVMFVATKSMDKVSKENPGFAKPLGHALELVPLSNPVTPMGPGVPISVQLIYKGKPLAKTRVSFIPRGATLKAEFDDQYERMTDSQGKASYTPTEGNFVLVAAHVHEPEEKGENFDNTKYCATLVVYVPQMCPCCDE
jgi:uncharacterized GH25 family protein